jgi:hypothetical protein
MACSKYTLTNTGSTLVNFNYRRCDDSLWEYQVELNPNQTKNIWLIDNTYSIASSFSNSVVLVNLGVFPAVSPTPSQTPTNTNTPTTTHTPTQTSTSTQTPTQTSTNTPTPTNTETPTNTPTPTPTETSTNTPTPTQTETPTNTPTPTQTETPTNTPTQTQTPTSTFTYYTYTLGFGNTDSEACNNYSSSPQTVYGQVVDGPGPTNYEILYQTPGNPLTNPVADGYYSNGTAWFIVSGGLGEITSSDPNGCVGLITPTQTPTQTSTPTQTPTETSTPTPTQTETPTNTPTQTQTQTNTPTNTQTPTNTETPTPTPTNTETPTNTPTNTQTQTQTGTPTNTQTPTNTETTTNTPTPTNTETPTPTQTSSPTPTFAYYAYSLGSGVTSNDACINFSVSPTTIYGTVAEGPGPTVGDILFETPGIPLTDAVPDGYYSNGVAWYRVTGGSGLITSQNLTGCD